jgi:nitrogen fixation/metabolism regulation signal transduction histidine kinase
MLVIFLTAIIPLAMSVWLADSLFKSSAARFNPDVDQQLDRGVATYKMYIRAVRDDMKHQADAIGADEQLRELARTRDAAMSSGLESKSAMTARLEEIFPSYPELVSLAIEDPDGSVLASYDRGFPVDDTKEKQKTERRPLTNEKEPPLLVATFAIDSSYEKELEKAAVVITTYKNIEKNPSEFYSFFRNAFIALLVLTVVITLGLGFVFARGVTRRINRLSNAINLVAAGDLSVRVPVTGSDELTELARVFNRMLNEMQQSRARIEYLQRIGAWQEMAQRLAHEIKNPLTPIQLAVQECHRKYGDADPKFRALLDTTLEIVEEEVGTLRRLVGNFSDFARLPQVELTESDLRDFLRECKEQLVHLEDEASAEALDSSNVSIEWDVPEKALRAAIDRQMLRRVLVNLVRNGAQAIRDARAPRGDDDAIGHVTVSARGEDDGAAIVVEDDGPGVPEEMRERIFEPYFTTKKDGTGLGLAIVKKIVVEHGGSIEASSSARLGGAAFVVRLPGPNSLAIAAARERGAAAVVPTSRPSVRSLQ